MRGSSSNELRDEAEAAVVALSGRLSRRLPPLAVTSGGRRKSATHTTTTLQTTHSFTEHQAAVLEPTRRHRQTLPNYSVFEFRGILIIFLVET